MSYQDVIISHAPVSYWQLNETFDRIAYDSVDSNPGIYIGYGYLQNQSGIGLLKPSLSFGSSFYISIADATNLRFSTTVSYEAWFLANSNINIFSKGDSFLSSHLSIDIGTSITITIGSIFWNIAYTTNNGRWYHIVVTIQSSNIIKVYIDGVLINSKSIGSITLSNTDPLYIGIGGKKMHCAVYNYILTDLQVLIHYNASLAASKRQFQNQNLTAGITG